MKHIKPYNIFERIESKIPDEDYHQIKEILANSLDGSTISFDVDDIKDVEYVNYANIYVYGVKPEVQSVHGYQSIQISITVPIPRAVGWVHDKKYKDLERDMKPYLDKFESFLNDFGYYLRRSPDGPLQDRYYNFAFYVTKSTQELPGYAHFRDTEFAKELNEAKSYTRNN